MSDAFDKPFPGEDIFISLYGAATDYNIRLDKNTVKMENTFISCASQRQANPDSFLMCSHCCLVY